MKLIQEFLTSKGSKLLVCSLVCLVQLLPAHTLNAQELKVGTVSIGQRGFVDKDGTTKGSSVEIVNRIVEEAGYTAVNKLMPLPRLLRSLETGSTDISLLVPSDKVRQLAVPLIHLQDVEFILISNSNISAKQLENLDGKSVGYLRSSRITENMLKELDVKRVEGDKYTHLIQMLLHRRIDALIGVKYNVNFALHQLGYSPTRLGESLVVKKLHLHLVYSKKTADQQVMAALITAAKKLLNSGEIQEIIDRYSYAAP